MQSYLVTMIDRVTNQECRVIVQSPCACDMQAFVEELAADGRLDITNPVIVDIDDRAARHLPQVDPVD